ncbi:hypothetical protein [Cellulomonas chengniuliangii]|uniref:Uncharacterized protein n=1 Tax=Cellulomonas chengniuliangii TaxID=2968084 RepID=A0ABY5L3F4_9CELL|nr:hypothetical protein [Cellulomonas chengniuliangii]UUI76087.1 hypothetical protein NP064_04045 [Cellulomonas chengniuliangii]
MTTTSEHAAGGPARAPHDTPEGVTSAIGRHSALVEARTARP